MIAAIVCALLAGCGYSGPISAMPAVALSGSVQGGHQPISGASISLYAAGASGTASAAEPLLSTNVKTDGSGKFSIPASYGCPSASAPVYLVARGGGPASSASNNPALVLMAMIGPCDQLNGLSAISVNEVTTVGSVWPLAAYMTDATHLGSASNDPAFLAAVATVPEFINNVQGSSPGTATATSYFAENTKLDSLANALADCVNSAGGSAGDSNACGQLFAAATAPGASAPTDTVTAALEIAQNPKNNVAGIYSVAQTATPFAPALTTAPTDWTLTLSYTIAAPTISLPTGTYNSAQEVTLSDSTPGSTIYYTTDGTIPTTSSATYSGPISVAATTTLQAIAVLQGSQSTVASSTLIIAVINPPERLVFGQQPTTTSAGAVISPAITVMVEDDNGNLVPSAANAILLTLIGGTGLQGTVTLTPQNGMATFNNLSVSNAGTYTLVAISPSLTSATSKSFTISSPGAAAPAPAKLAFLQQPSNAAAGATITPSVTVAVEDSNGNAVTTAASPVTLALGGGAGLAGTLTATPQNGIATFSNLSLGIAGTYTLQASSASLTSATSNHFTITALAAVAAKLAFSQQPSSASSGATITPAVTVVVEDSNGNPVAGASNAVTVALTTGSGLAGTLTATPQNGVATFSNLSESTAGTYTLSATSPGLSSATSSSFTISTVSSTGANYYIAPGGNDSNSGTSPTSAWLTPNHALNCGDVISAAPGNYAASNFGPGHWGTVSCPAGNNVAWLQCATFDTCKITATGSDAMWVDRSYWGVQGWENSTNTTTNGACFHAGPSGGSTVHHIIFANNVANGCMGGGFNAYNSSTSASVDYITYVGNVAYNAAQGSGACYSGFNIYQPIASDTASGTHNYAAGNFSYNNSDGDPCAGTAPTDGEGINFDTWDFDQGGGTPYTQQGAMENNIAVFNGGRGIYVENNNAGSTHAHIYMQGNTLYGNNSQLTQAYCSGNGDLTIYNASNITASANVIQTNSATMCSSAQPKYAIALSTANDTVSINNNYASGVNGYNTMIYNAGSFALGSANVIGTDPNYANPVNPGAPSCSGSPNVPACMATLIANFTPTNAAAKAFGYQPPSSTSVSDPLYPQWLCSVTLPAGLVTKGCN